MAEGIARAALEQGTAGVEGDVFVASAGVHAFDGAPISAETVRALSERGIEPHGASKALTAEMIQRADAVLAMTQAHVESARALVAVDTPEAAAKIMRLDPDGDIEDPIGMGQAAYDRLAERLSSLIPRRLEEVLS
jgi:protein-tyrosine-phosphatase